MPNKLTNKKSLRILAAVLVVVAIGLSIWLFNSQETSDVAQAGWYNEDWYYRRQLIVDETKVGATLTDFPVAVQFNTTDSNPYSGTNSDGSDIRFTDYQGNLLSYEIEKWNESGTSTVWVKLPSVASTTPTNFFMYYGNPSAIDEQSPYDVWDDNYVMVLHFDETSGYHQDSTRYGNNTTYHSGIDSQGTANAKFGYGDEGANLRMEVDNHPSLSGMAQLTFEGWLSMDSFNASGI